VVVFPTPPFWFAMAMTFTGGKDGRKSVFLNAKLSGEGEIQKMRRDLE
jgi:hypothetical protein